MYGIYNRYYCYPHLYGTSTYLFFNIMSLVLTSVCCDSSALIFTQNLSVPVSPSTEIRMCSGTHVYLLSGVSFAGHAY